MQQQINFIKTHSAEEILEKYGIVVNDQQIQNDCDGILANYYPNIFSIRYQSRYVNQLDDKNNYIIFDVRLGLKYDDQLIKYNLQSLSINQTCKPIKLYEQLYQQSPSDFKENSLKENKGLLKILNQNKSSDQYFIALKYDDQSYKLSTETLPKEVILSNILQKQLISIDETTSELSKIIDKENRFQQQFDDYIFKSDFSRQNFDTPFNYAVKANLIKYEDDYLNKRLWYNIGLFLEKVQ